MLEVLGYDFLETFNQGNLFAKGNAIVPSWFSSLYALHSQFIVDIVNKWIPYEIIDLVISSL